MDRLAACHLMHGFMHVPGNRRRHPTAPNCQNVKAAQRSLSLADRRGIVSPAWASRRGLISPMPHHTACHELDDEMGGEHGGVKRIHNMSLVMKMVDASHLNSLSNGMSTRSARPASASALPTDMVVPHMGTMTNAASFSRDNTWQSTRRRAVAATIGASTSAAQRRRQPMTQRKPEPRIEAGELMLSLCYFPELGKLVVNVLKARDLPGRDKFTNTDSYVKIWLIQKGRRIEKHKTAICPQTQAPVYNESFVFGNLPGRETLRYDANLVVTAMDYDLVTTSEEIGHVVIGALGDESAFYHWRNALDAADKPFTAWHRLTPRW